MTRMTLWIAAAVTCGALSAGSSANAISNWHGPWLDRCTTARLVAAWIRRGYGRTAAIAGASHWDFGHRVRYVGRLHAGARDYGIYFDASVDPQSQHGSSGLVVTTVSGQFLGSYDVGAAQPVRIEGSDILFDSRKEDGDLMRFGPNGPPEKAWIDGENPEFNSTADWQKAFPKGVPWGPPRVAAYCKR